jgi:hypothetical protein
MHKNPNPKPGWRSFSEGLEQLNREANGLFRVELIRPEDHSAIAFSARTGDKTAWARVNAILESNSFIRAMGKNKPVVCLTCPGHVHDPDAALALLVAAHDATMAVCSALCPECSTGAAEQILERVAAGYQAAWPGLLCVAVTHPEGGRA